MRQKLGVFTGVVSAGAVTLQNPSIDLPRTHYLKNLFFQISLSVANTAGGGTVIQDALARFFGFRLFVEGDDPIIALRGDNLKTYLYNHHDQATNYTEITNVKGAVTGTWNFQLPIADRRLRNNRRLTRIDLALSDNPRLEMTFGASGAALETTGDAVITAVSVTVWGDYDYRPAGLPGPDTLARYAPLRRIREITKSDLVASTNDQQVNLPFGRLVREYHFIVRDRAASPARSDALVQRIELAPNLVRDGKQEWQDILSETRFGLSVTPLVGAGVMDFDQSRQLIGAEMLNLIGHRQMSLFVDTNAAANNIDLVIIEESIDFPNPAAVELVRKFAV